MPVSESRTRRAPIGDHRVTDDQGDRLRVHTRAALAADPDVVSDVAVGLQRLCDAAAAELRLAGVSVTLVTGAGTYALVADAGEHGRRLDELQFDLGEGPARDAFSAGRPVLAGDLRECMGRWPGFAPAAVEEAMLAVFTFPLQLGAVRFGVLTCMDHAPRALASHEVSACLIFAEVATELLLDSSPSGRHPDPDLRTAVQAREQIYQAQGMLTVDLDVDLAEALARMRATAYVEGITLHELGADIVAGRRRLSPDEGEDPPTPPADDA